MSNKLLNEKMWILINYSFNQLKLYSDIFDKIDQKTQWFFIYLSWIQWYLFVNYPINSLNIYCTKDFFMFLSLLIWLIILVIYVYIMNVKQFSLGPNIKDLTSKNWNDNKTIKDLNYDILDSLNKSQEINLWAIGNKSYCFKLSIYLFWLYIILLLFYFY